ncbi:ThiF family adenylyltransferase [Pseudomonas extremaustralis]|uniref:ThiF family adenylyltransferase n=1 Tax=Pseudomonas extremaustralis TaxID=359110 RepID=UPI00117B1ECE
MYSFTVATTGKSLHNSKLRQCARRAYSRSELYYQSVGASPSTINSNLSNASVSIIGCGGIGNHISAALATSGVGEIHIGAKKTSTLSKVSEQGARDVKS